MGVGTRATVGCQARPRRVRRHRQRRGPDGRRGRLSRAARRAGRVRARRDVRTLVPVSVRSSEEHGEYNNRVSAIFANLPVGIEDPVARLAAVQAQMEHLKHSGEAVAGDVLVGLSGFAPAMLLALGLRAATRMPQHSVNTVTTNVPGPQQPLYAAASLGMLECFPYVPIAGHVRVGVAIFSYDGGLTFGVTGDYDQAPDIDVLCEGIEHSMRELLAAAERAGRTERVETPGHSGDAFIYIKMQILVE